MIPSTRCVLAALGTIGGLAAPSFASQLELTLVGSGLHQNVVAWHGTFASAANPEGKVRLAAGQHIWDVGVGSAAPVREHLFSVLFVPPAGGVAGLQSLTQAMAADLDKGVARALLIQNLYASARGQANLSETHAAAFQVAIWEMAHEAAFDPVAGTFNLSGLDAANGDVGSGGFAVGNGRTGTRDPIASLANQWLSDAWERWNLGQGGVPLSLTEGPEGGGQLLDNPMIPLPSAGALALVGMLGIGGYRRRRG
jgi:hypothetical protein